MTKSFLLTLLPASCFAAGLSVPLTVQEAIFPGSMTGLARTNEPVTVGVPLPDAGGIANTSTLGLTGATAAQFSVEGLWPDGNIKWLKIRAIVPSLAAGGTTTLTLTNSGTGNFGGANLATDNGATITVATGAATFTIKKSNFNVVDQVVVGGTTVVASGASQGLVVLGPNPTAAYPGNVTCSPTAGGTACSTVYSTANDGTNSTCTIEENGPAMAVLNCQADLNDGAGHVYMHTTTRLHFSQGSAKLKATVALRNADLGANSSNFATAYKGIQGFELRIKPSLSGPLSYSIGAQTCPNGVCTGTLTSGSNDYAYVYGSEFDWLQWGGDYINGNCPATPSYNRCVKYSPLQGYAVMKSVGGAASTQATGTFSQYPAGWADISNASGAGVEIGQYQMAGYGNESLEFRGGGNDVRVGMWAAENNTTSPSTLTPNVPYYVPYPEYSIHDVYLNFHATAPGSLPGEFLKQQHYLLARASYTWYNSSGVFYYPLEDPTEESTYYTNALSAYSPAVSNSSVGPAQYQDLGATNTYYWPLTAHKFYLWSAGGSSNQSDLRLSELYNFLRRGHTGEYLNAAHFYKLIAETGLPRADGFSWASQPGSNTLYYNYPAVTDNNTNANASLGMKNWVADDMEHAHFYGVMDYYFLSGDETYKDFIVNAYADTYLNTVSSNNMISNYGAPYTSERTAGNNLMAIARLANFFRSTGNSTKAGALLGRANTIWTTMLKANLCTQSGGAGDPSGCTANLSATNIGVPANHGTSFDRGVTYQFGNYAVSAYTNTCNYSSTGGQPRSFEPIMVGPLLQGMWEFRSEEGSSWPDYNAVLDYAFGIMQSLHGTSGMGGSLLGEMYVDNGTNSWSGNGMRYIQWIDGPNSCSTAFNPQNFDAFWPGYWIEHQYLGQSQTNLNRQITMMIENVMNSCGSGFEGSCAEIWHYGIGRLIYVLNHPNSYSLVTLTPSAFHDNGDGTYNIGLSVPSGATSFRVKWGTRNVVDYIGYNAGSGTWIGNPATTQNWWSSTDATGIPTPTTGAQTITVGTNPATPGLTASNFMIKAYVGGSGVTAPPPSGGATTSVIVTSPTAGTTVSGTVNLVANATGSGSLSVQFTLDGANLGSAASGSGPSYSSSWDTTKTANGSHVLSAVVTDGTGATAVSSSVTVTVSNAAQAPTVTAVTAAAVTSSGVTITWTTNVPADSQVAYGLSTSYGNNSPLSTTLVTSHSVTLTGLTSSTTYHFQVLSHTSQGTLGTSQDSSFTTASNSTGGTSLPLNTWTAIQANGYPAEIYGYDKSVYVNSRNIHCIWGGYHQPLSSEPNEATVCYSYAENRWFVLQNNGMWHSDHVASSGHTTSVWAYMPDRDSIVGMTDGTGSNSPEEFFGHWWLVDIGGLSGQDKEFSPRAWLGATTPAAALTYDSTNLKLVLFPDLNGVVEVCDPAANSCAAPSTSGTAPPAVGNLSLAYNTTDHKVYLYGGGQANIYTFNVATNAWAKLTTTCTGKDCAGTAPPARMAAGFAYSSADNIFLMAGGVNSFGATAYTDTWIFNPATLSWTEQATTGAYSNDPNSPTFDRLTYDAASNVFILMSSGGGNTYAGGTYNAYTAQIWAYAYSAASSYGRTSNTYAPPSGALNRIVPTTTSQSWAFDPAIVASGNTAYVGWIETGAPFDTSNCGLHHPYIQSGNGITSWTALPGGSQTAACTALDSEPVTDPGNTDDSNLRLTVVNGTLWEAHEKWNLSGITSSAWSKYWNGSAWSGGQVGCFSATCSSTLVQRPVALTAVHSTPTLAVIEQNHTVYIPEEYLYVAQWNGANWGALGGKLNINGTGSRVLSASLATDGTNPAACWSEEVQTSRSVVSVTPQIQCAQWNGSGWPRMGAKSLNQSATSWAYSPTMTYAGGKFYTGWVERTTGGVTKLYVCQWSGASCTLLGNGPLNISVNTGWAAHPSLATDGTSVYVAWEEQPALNQHSMGYVMKWSGSSWSQVGGALNADSTNGSVEGISLDVVQGLPTAIWTELTYGSLRQAYVKQWNGSTWVGASGSSSSTPSAPPPPPPATISACDLNGDGVVNSADVTLAINQALGVVPCTNGSLQQNGQCNIVGVQRVINASLGGTCRTGN
jgi:hypothetical protein